MGMDPPGQTEGKGATGEVEGEDRLGFEAGPEVRPASGKGPKETDELDEKERLEVAAGVHGVGGEPETIDREPSERVTGPEVFPELAVEVHEGHSLVADAAKDVKAGGDEVNGIVEGIANEPEADMSSGIWIEKEGHFEVGAATVAGAALLGGKDKVVGNDVREVGGRAGATKPEGDGRWRPGPATGHELKVTGIPAFASAIHGDYFPGVMAGEGYLKGLPEGSHTEGDIDFKGAVLWAGIAAVDDAPKEEIESPARVGIRENEGVARVFAWWG